MGQGTPLRTRSGRQSREPVRIPRGTGCARTSERAEQGVDLRLALLDVLNALGDLPRMLELVAEAERLAVAVDDKPRLVPCFRMQIAVSGGSDNTGPAWRPENGLSRSPARSMTLPLKSSRTII